MSDTLPDTPAAGPGLSHGGGGILSKRIHGIPVVPVAVVSGLAIAGVLLYRRYKGSAPSNAVAAVPTSAVTDDPGTLPTGGDGYSGDDGSALDTLTTGNGSGPSTTTSTTLTNTQWVTNAIDGLVGQGQNSPTDIQNALENFVNGVPLANAQQQAIVNQAIAVYGEPPQNILQTSLGPQTAQLTSGYHPYVTKKGDTIDAILQATYNQVDSVIVTAFWDANPHLIASSGKVLTSTNSAQNLLKTGQTIHLPIFTEGTLP